MIDPLEPGSAIEVHARGCLPVNVDTVAPRRIAAAFDAVLHSHILLHRSLPPGTNVIERGSECASGDVLLRKGQRITPEQQAVLIAAGVRELKVSKRPRVGVVVSSYERCSSFVARSDWQTHDICGPYIRTLMRRWGFETPQIEYVSPPAKAKMSSEAQWDAELCFRRRVIELGERYDLIVGSGMLPIEPYRRLGLNSIWWFDACSSDDVTEVNQAPGSRFNVATGRDRSPPFKEILEFFDNHGRRGVQFVYHHDQATLVNLPGFLSSVAVLMHVMVRRIIDLYEFVEAPGPYWEIGELARDVECDRKINQMQWAKIVWGTRGEPLIDPLPVQAPHRITSFLEAEVIAAIPACRGRLAAGSRIHFLRLDPLRQPAAPNRASPAPIEINTEANPPTEPVPRQRQMNIAQSWSRLETWLQSMPDAVPGGFNGAASDDEIQILEGALGAKLPADFVASLKTHNGQPDQCGGCFEGDSLLDVKGILSEWGVWHELVVKGAFEETTSDPDAGVKDDWYNLRWIPFTRNGMGDSFCLDLDPAPGGTFGQVIRVWHDDERRERIAASFEHWLHLTVADITGLEEQEQSE